MILPHGFDDLVKNFGDPRPYLASGDARGWEDEILVSIPLPFPLRYYWGKGEKDFSLSKSLRVHKMAAEVFTLTLECVQREGLESFVDHHGGAYAFRHKRGSAKLSTHVWALAHDLNPRGNPMGAPGNMNADVIEIYRAHGWTWGGDWAGKKCDPMHFQLVSGY